MSLSAHLVEDLFRGYRLDFPPLVGVDPVLGLLRPGRIDLLAGRKLETRADLLDQFGSIHRRQVQSFSEDLSAFWRHNATPVPWLLYDSTIARALPRDLPNEALPPRPPAGSQIDEMPVLTEGCDEPLAAGMVLALEPTKGISGVGNRILSPGRKTPHGGIPLSRRLSI